MVSEGKGRLFRRKDGKYLIYLPLALVTDSSFPFKDWKPSSRSEGSESIRVKVFFNPKDPRALIITELNGSA